MRARNEELNDLISIISIDMGITAFICNQIKSTLLDSPDLSACSATLEENMGLLTQELQQPTVPKESVRTAGMIFSCFEQNVRARVSQSEAKQGSPLSKIHRNLTDIQKMIDGGSAPKSVVREQKEREVKRATPSAASARQSSDQDILLALGVEAYIPEEDHYAASLGRTTVDESGTKYITLQENIAAEKFETIWLELAIATAYNKEFLDFVSQQVNAATPSTKEGREWVNKINILLSELKIKMGMIPDAVSPRRLGLLAQQPQQRDGRETKGGPGSGKKFGM